MIGILLCQGAKIPIWTLKHGTANFQTAPPRIKGLRPLDIIYSHFESLSKSSGACTATNDQHICPCEVNLEGS